jgi:hypothetical protein
MALPYLVTSNDDGLNLFHRGLFAIVARPLQLMAVYSGLAETYMRSGV